MYQQERFKEYNNIQISKNTDKFLKCKQLNNFHFLQFKYKRNNK